MRARSDIRKRTITAVAAIAGLVLAMTLPAGASGASTVGASLTSVGGSPTFDWRFAIKTARGDGSAHAIVVRDAGAAVEVTDSAGAFPRGDCSAVNAETVTCPVSLSTYDFETIVMDIYLGSGSDLVDLTGLPVLRGTDGTTDPNSCCDDAAVYVVSGPGRDRVLTSQARLVATLGRGPDTAVGGIGFDRIYGDEGNDRLFGMGGNDRLFGNSGWDTLRGGAGADKLRR